MRADSDAWLRRHKDFFTELKLWYRSTLTLEHSKVFCFNFLFSSRLLHTYLYYSLFIPEGLAETS
jgi:hypothetical protein